MHTLVEALRVGRVLLMDGAMGTELQRAGLCDSDCCESWNLAHPDRVSTVHTSYVDAGATVLLTNTFQAHSTALQRYGLGDHLADVWSAAIRLARRAAPDSWILADLGPFETDSNPEQLRLLIEFCRQTDGLFFETLSELDGSAVSFLAALRESDPQFPVFVSFTYLKEADGEVRTRTGQTAQECAHQAIEAGASAVGTNCGRDIGLPEMCEVISSYRCALGQSVPVFARPNAGSPAKVGDKWRYPRTAEMMASGLNELIDSGVNMIGGCCGTSPEHISAFRKVIAARAPRDAGST
jgi:5-methyltetrahydrofolate--homocysteine methyltransferase